MRFKVLGPLEVVGDGGPVTIYSRKVRGLLAMLLLSPGKVMPIADLVDGIWPASPPASAIANIRTYAHRIRRILRECGEPAARLASHHGGYQLNACEDELDLLRFAGLARDGHQALRAGRYRHAADLLSGALSLWRGRPLEDLPELGSLISAKAVALEDQRWAAAAAWVDACTALGRHEDVVPLLRQMSAERPLCERTCAQLMVALSSDGRRDEALAAYRSARRTLVDELGVEPGTELQAVHLAVLEGNVGVGWRQAAFSAAGR